MGLLTDPQDPALRFHELHPKGCGTYSINAGGDLRLLFTRDQEGVIFIDLGTHSQLYG